MKKIVCALLALAMIFACASCSRGSGGNIVYPIEVSPDTLDPQYAKDTGAQIIINNIFEGLVRYDGDGKIIPGIAEEWTTSEDGLTWTFTLKNKTEWYCSSAVKNVLGDEAYDSFSTAVVTADDFVFACRRSVDPATDSPYSHRMTVIENASEIISGNAQVSSLGVTAIDDSTLEFRLSEPCSTFLDRLTEPEFMPCNEEFFNSTKGRYGLSPGYILCNGPFYVSAWDPESTMTCKSNKYYAGEQAVLPSSVVFAFNNTESEVLTKLSNGGISAALISPDSALPDNTVVAKELKNSVYGFVFNCKDASLCNADIRKALCSSVKKDIFSTNTENTYDIDGIVPGICTVGSENYRESVSDKDPRIEYSPEQASTYWSRGIEYLGVTQVTLEVLCPEWADTAIREQLQVWEELFGISLGITVKTADAEEIDELTEDGEYQIAFCGIDSDYTDAVSFLAEFRDGGIFGFDSYNYRAITDTLTLLETEEDIEAGCFAAEEYLLKSGICYPLYTRSTRFVTHEETADITILNSESTVCFITARRYDS